MADIPDDITAIIEEIDEELKAQGIPPHARDMRAVMAFGKRFGIGMPIAGFSDPRARPDIAANQKYAQAIYDWYKEIYGERLKVDPSERAKVAVIADGDLWQLRLPIIFGSANLAALPVVLGRQNEFSSTGPVLINVCEALVDITEARLKKFSDRDLDEVMEAFVVGMDVREAFRRYSQKHSKFAEAEADWAAAIMHLTARSPSYGQSRWSSLQMAEKFMKGIIAFYKIDAPRRSDHKLKKLLGDIKTKFTSLDLDDLIGPMECSAGVRYGEIASTRAEAYAAHQASLKLIARLAQLDLRPQSN